MSLIVSDDAIADVTSASVFYDTRPGKYGAAFENEVEAAIRKIGGTPRMYPPVEDGIPGREIREFYIERFEQRVIYVLNGDEVLVVTVVHAPRKEGSWHRRLPTDTGDVT